MSKEADRKYRQNNLEACRERDRAYVAANYDTVRERQRQAYQDNKETVLARRRELARETPARSLLQKAKGRAKKQGVPFDLVLEDIIIPDLCPILGIPLVVNDGKHGPDSATLDRVAPKLGYVKGNIQVISYKANTMKSDGTFTELHMLADWIKANIPSERS